MNSFHWLQCRIVEIRPSDAEGAGVGKTKEKSGLSIMSQLRASILFEQNEWVLNGLRTGARVERGSVCRARQTPPFGAHSALSLSMSQCDGYSTSEDRVLSNHSMFQSVNEAQSEAADRVQGASCAWPRACAWPNRDARTESEVAQDALSDVAAAASMSDAVDWSPDSRVIVMTEVDTDLPPDVELLALFSDSPISWRAHDIEEEDGNRDCPPSAAEKLANDIGKWWGKMWRYQGLGL
jgi:hypothetical protein